jgi:simple sugar transport system substrate-binding protein
VTCGALRSRIGIAPTEFTIKMVATGATTALEGPAEKAFFISNKDITGAFAVDAGSTELLGPQLVSAGLADKIPVGGFDTATRTLEAIKAGQLDFTINQDPYMQGFLPVLYLYMFNLTGGLVLPPDTDTGLSFVTSSNIGPYLNSSTTYVAQPAPPSPRWCRAAAPSPPRSPPRAPDGLTLGHRPSPAGGPVP